MKKLLLLPALAFLISCSDDDVSTSSPFVQDIVETPVTPPSLDVGFDQTEISIAEGDDAVTVTLNLAAAAPAGGTITVARIDADSSTASASDYTATFEGTITIAEGDESKEFSIQANDDSEQEDDEVVYFSVTSDVAILGITSTVLKVNITSNEIPETIVIVQENGDLFSVNPANGDTLLELSMTTVDYNIESISEIHKIKVAARSNEVIAMPLSNVQSFIYDESNGKAYAMADSYYTYEEEAEDNEDLSSNEFHSMYEVDLATGDATIFSKEWQTNDEPSGGDGFWPEVYDMVIGAYEFFVSGYVYEFYEYSGEIGNYSGGGIIAVDRIDGAVGGLNIPYGYGGILLSEDQKSIYYGGSEEYGNGFIVSYELDFDEKYTDPESGTEIEMTVTSEEDAKFEAITGEGLFDIGSYYVSDFAQSSTGTVYALLTQNHEEEDIFLVTINLETGAVSFVSLIYDSSEDEYRKAGLAILPSGVL